MRGSLIISFDDFDGFGGDYLDIVVNSVLKKRIYTNSSSLYSCPLYVGDVVRLQHSNVAPPNLLDLSVFRRDYTTDDEGGDNGIKTTLISNSVNVTGITFTATTISSSYDFEYRIDITSIIPECMDIGVGFDFRSEEIKYKNGKAFIGGAFTTYNNISTSRFVVLDDDGSINSGFIPNLINQAIRTIEILSDDKILLGGNFTTYSGVSKNRIVKLNSDYSIDTGFTVGTGFEATVADIEIQSDGKIVICGGFNTYNGSTAYKITRLQTDGNIDTTFSGVTSIITPGPFDSYQDLDIQSDGKILMVGQFNNWDNNNNNISIVRLNSNGSVDNTFVSPFIGLSGLTNNSIYRVIQLSSGKILISGPFRSASIKALARLNSDGSIDNTFNFNSTGIFGITDIAVLSNGKILAYETLLPATQSRIRRYNSDGTVDNSFNVVTTNQAGGFSNNLETLCVKPNGNILVTGNFTSTSIGNYNRFFEISSEGISQMCP